MGRSPSTGLIGEAASMAMLRPTGMEEAGAGEVGKASDASTVYIGVRGEKKRASVTAVGGKVSDGLPFVRTSRASVALLGTRRS